MHKLTYIDNCCLDVFILKKILSRFGPQHEVNCTGSADEVLTQLAQHGLYANDLPDIILLDIYSPQFDAWDFLDKIDLLLPALAKPVEVYILSAFNYPADVERARQYSCVKAFILKPITKEGLLKLIQQKEMPEEKFLVFEMQN